MAPHGSSIEPPSPGILQAYSSFKIEALGANWIERSPPI